MKIKDINNDRILFDNGSAITFYHEQDCCEYNYADFEQLDDIARTTNFDEPLIFEAIQDSGFRFGNDDGRMFFVPCYSDQNGYYSTDINIEYNGKTILNMFCELNDCY